MILSLIVLFVTTIYLLITTFYYRDKYYCDHNLVEILDESTFMYYKQMVDLDIENDLLKKLISSIKLENAELKSNLYIGFPSRNVGGDSK